jgi:hypothetical protein
MEKLHMLKMKEKISTIKPEKIGLNLYRFQKRELNSEVMHDWK